MKQAPITKDMLVSSGGKMPLDQLQDFIKETIKDKYEVSVESSLMYAKTYTIRIDSFKMPTGYQPPKFLQFDGKEDPKKHVTTLLRHVITLRPMQIIFSISSSAP